MHVALEIFGGGMTHDLAELLIQWLGHYTRRDHADDMELQNIIDDLMQQRFDKAEENIHIYLFKKPKSAVGRIIAGTLCVCRNSIEDAIEEFLVAYSLNPSNTISLYTLGCCFEKRGCHEKAIEFYQDCLKFDRCLELPLRRLAALYLKAHRLEEVIHQYIILTELSPEDLSAAIILGYLYITVGEYDKAVDVFHQAIIMHPDNITLKDDDIDRYMDQNRLNEALEGIERLLQWLPDNPAAFVKKGDIFDLMGEPLEAIAAYTKAYDIVPHSLDIALKLTSEYIQIDDFKRAAFIFNRALESNEQMLDVYLGLALSHHSTGDTHSALASLNSASMLMPTSALLYTQLVTMLLQTYVECEEAFLDIGGQNNLVLDTHRSIMAATPHNPMLHYQQGLLHYHYFGPQAALADFHTCYELNALEHRAFSKSIVCEYAIGNNYQALNDLSRLVYIDFDTTDLYYQTSLLYSDKAKFAASLLNLSQQVDSHKESALHISIILQKLGILDRTDTLWHELNEMLMGCLEAT